MEELMNRIWQNLIARLHGPLSFRFILQPVMVAILALLDGLNDARAGRVPYLWALFTMPEHRKALLHEGWKAVLKVFILACVLDLIFQLIVLRAFYPGEMLLVAFLLAIVPYLFLRGLVTRIARLWLRRPRSRKPEKGGMP